MSLRCLGVSIVSVVLFAACATSGNDAGFAPDDGVVEGGAGSGDPGPGLNVPESGMTVTDGGGLLNEGSIDAEPSCTPDAGGPGPVKRVCLGATNNECDGNHDLPGFPANGTGGNGFDDDCDGLVDEGCECTAPGITKDCYLVPASQTAAGLPVGWCAQNSKGTVDCIKNSNEFNGTWSGQCRGAQPPFADDICAKGDFDCDGREENSRAHDCTCGPGSVACPTDPLETVPYPPPTQLPLKVDGNGWFQNPSEASQATNWKWTLTGGDCDNVLPHPTFAMFTSQDGTKTPVGGEVDTLGTSKLEHGIVATQPEVTSSFYPAFSLSGDYVVTGEFDLFGKHYACSQKIQVRAPGLRAEACWDTEQDGVDLDLHVARVDGFTCAKKGWSDTCKNQDCYYSSCVNGSSPGWFPSSPNSACHGWGSQTTGTCFNPRLDRDANGVSGTCDPSVSNPYQTGDDFSGGFCGPENVNVDAPTTASTYAVAVKYYGGSAPSRAHVNVYCNGARVLSTGFNPVTGVNYPELRTSGGDTDGDMWKVGLVGITGSGASMVCNVQPSVAKNPVPATDGPTGFCVDTTATNGANSVLYLASSGGVPADANALCFH
jgi:hypothetical protein